ncbi:MAG TPA: AraC family transcriptional regulator [Alcanivorax sp.]|nr:AraC family transcriptional regulator [Alcanivorax sp.]
MGSPGFVSSAGMRAYLAAARAAGVDNADALTAAGIDPRILGLPDVHVPGDRFAALITALADRSGDPLFGLHASEYLPPGVFNVLGYIALSASTLLEALAKVARYEKRVGDLGRVETQLRGNESRILWHCHFTRQPVRRHLVEAVFAGWLGYTRWLADDPALTPERVWFEHAGPTDARQTREYQRLFGCPVDFSQPYSALIGDRDMLARPPRRPQPHQLGPLEDHAARHLETLGIATTLSLRVRHYLQAALGGPLPDRDQVAHALRLNTRTLHRHLVAEGTGWREILDSVRLERAKTRLLESRCPQAEIAADLGYADIRCFQRSFKRHTGVTPGQYRRGVDSDGQ